MSGIVRMLRPAVGFLPILICLTLPAGRTLPQEQRPRTAGQRQQSSQPVSTDAGKGAVEEETVRVKSRIVVVQTLVKDKRTGAPVEGLRRENFEVLDDGRPRTLTYFSAGGDGQRPLALVLVVDGCTGFQNVWLDKAAGVMGRMAAALEQLPPEDEVAVLWTRCGANHDPCATKRLGAVEVRPLTLLQGLTRDRAAVSAALRSVPRLAAEMIEEERPYYGVSRRKKDTPSGGLASGITCVPGESLRLFAERPASQPALLFVTDDIGLVRAADRDASAESLTRAGVPAYGLITGRSFFINLGVAQYGVGSADDRRANAVQYWAKETGGEAVRVGDPEKYAEAFGRIVGGLAARYSLGFTLGDDEPEDGRLHRLDVKVKARDARAKELRVAVSARRGYYAPDVSAGGPPMK